MRVAKGNEDMATKEVMAYVAKLHQMVEDFKAKQQEIIDFAEECGLWHIDLSCNLEYTDVQYEHEQWLASDHNC
ncbi:hypothetical protein D3C85_566410 [compost metagenome]